MNTVERDGKFYVQCTDGEVEISPEQMEQSIMAKQVLETLANSWKEMYGHQNWSVGDVPKDAETYLTFAVFFQNCKRAIEMLYSEEEDKVKFKNDFSMVFQMKISEYERDLIVPYSDKPLIQYKIAGFKDMLRFLELLPLNMQNVDRDNLQDGYLQVINDIPRYDDGIEKRSADSTPEIATHKGTQMQVALFYYYLIAAGLREPMGFDPGEDGKMKAMEAIASKHGLSYKGFQLAFNQYSNKKTGAWITGTKHNIKDIEMVITMLADYPKAMAIATNDLKQAKMAGEKRGNPIT